MQFWRMIAAIFMLAASLAVLSSALAQQTPNKEPQLRSFAKAYVEVQKIREFYEPQLGTAQDPQKSSEIERENH